MELEAYREATLRTADNLRRIAQSQSFRELSRLSLPEIETAANLVAQIVPAGNVLGAILSGLARLPERRPPPQIIKRDIQLLFKGVEHVLDHAIYGAFFAGPAAVIWGYQNLLKLAGKDPDDSFPEGTWQFYVDYSLREDTARHTHETHGFDTLLNRHQIHLSPTDRLTAWVMAAIHCLHQYAALLENEWRERIYTYLLGDETRHLPEGARYAQLYRKWAGQRPYGRSSDVGSQETYSAYRRRKFDEFLTMATRELPDDLRRRWLERIHTAQERELPAYQRQMSLVAYLEPGPYGETRTPISLGQACVGVVHRGHYYLIPACSPESDQPANVANVRSQIAAMLASTTEDSPAPLAPLARLKRAALAALYEKFTPALKAALESLRVAPILINSDPRSRQLPLAELRQTERGVGDQALTLFDTGESLVFDQSHIFFDGAGGAALAEILTNESLSWAIYLHTLPQPQPGAFAPRRLTFPFELPDLTRLRQAPRVMAEAGAETESVNLKAILSLRKLFKRRNDLLQLTVNDLLVLYRAIHAATYRPDSRLVALLRGLTRDSAVGPAGQAALEAINSAGQTNPAILIPVDASQRSPRDRLYPMCFEVPLNELDLLNLHPRTLKALKTYQDAIGDRSTIYAEFDNLQRTYLATLAGFGAVLSKAKEIALTGESASVGTIKLLAHLPTPLQRLLDAVPGRFEVLNDIIKGREVFSNVGVVAPTSSLTRFITAKDDNEKKTLAWGALTVADGSLRLSLRDFRPHVGLLHAAGHKDIGTRIAQEYLDSYASGLNAFVGELRRIVLASRETRLLKVAHIE